MSRLTPHLWFDNQLEEAMAFYTSLFPNSSIDEVQRYGPDAPAEAANVVTATFTLDGQRFMGLNGGPEFRFNESFSIVVDCPDQAEVDRLWDALTADGGEPSQCGWCKDRFGLSWQIVPTRLGELASDPDPVKANAVLQAMLQMGKLDVAGLEAAYAGAS